MSLHGHRKSTDCHVIFPSCFLSEGIECSACALLMWKCCAVINKQTNQRKHKLLDCTSYNGSECCAFRVRRVSSLYESCSEHGERGSNGALHWRGLNFLCLWCVVLYKCAWTTTAVFMNLCKWPTGGHKPHCAHSFCHNSASIRQEERPSGDFTRAAVSSVHRSGDILHTLSYIWYRHYFSLITFLHFYGYLWGWNT